MTNRRLTTGPPGFILIGMNPSPLTDEELAARAGRDQSAFAELHRRYDARLRGYLRVQGHTPTAVPDISQDTWLKVFNKLRTGEPFDGHFRGWLFTVGANTGKDMAKKRKPLPLNDDVPPVARPQNWRPDAEDTAKLHQCYGGLSDRERDVVKRRLEGQAIPDVANTLQLTPDQVSATFHRAKEKLQTCLGVTKDLPCSP